MKPERYFFFSYARADRRNADRERLDGTTFNPLDELFARLCRCLSGMTAVSADKVGYRDTLALQVGAPWPRDLVKGMHDSQVLIALLSPYYFTSLNRGREFQVFVQRLDLLEQKVGDADIMSPIIPLFWENEDYCWRHANAEAREFLESFQLPVRGFPNDYPSVGLLRQLLLGKPNTYDEICFYLADRIKELAEREPPLPALEGINDFRKLPSAFDPGQKEDKPLEPAITPVLNLDEMQPPPGVAAAPAPSSLHLAQ